jgi:hypothetical protein
MKIGNTDHPSPGLVDSYPVSEIGCRYCATDNLADLTQCDLMRTTTRSTPDPSGDPKNDQYVDCINHPRPPMWRRDYDGSYDGAKTACAARGGRLPTFEEICPVTTNHGSDQWAPYDNGGSINAWVQVGQGGYTPVCSDHYGKYNVRPDWGLTIGRAPYQEWLNCVMPSPVWISSYDGTYDGAKGACAAIARKLPTYAQLCEEQGQMRRGPVGQWAPFDDVSLTGTSSVNEWAQIHDASLTTSCLKHTPTYGKPDWGQQWRQQPWQPNVLCV